MSFFQNIFQKSLEPQNQLLQYIKRGDSIQVRKFLKGHKGLLNEDYEDGKDVLETICSQYFSEELDRETIRELFKADYKMRVNTECGFKSLLHFAALGQNLVIIGAVIEKYPELLKLTAERNTALHTLIKEGVPYHNYDNFSECIRFLVDNGINANAKDKEAKTALEYAEEKAWKEKVDLSILIHKSEVNLAVPYAVPYQNDETSFMERFSAENVHELHTHLSYAVKKNWLEAVQFMIDNNQIIVGTTETHPLVIAKLNGYYDMMKLLLSAPGMHLPRDVREFVMLIDDGRSRKYSTLILNQPDLNINFTDEEGNTPLHVATKFGKWHVVMHLLEHDASLAIRNKAGQLAINDIESNLLRKHFDRCVKFDKVQNIYEGDRKLVFNFETILRTLKIPKMDSNSNNFLADVEMEALTKNQNDELVSDTNEVDVILHLSKEPEKRNLLQHPLITSFVHAKWHRVESFVFINFFTYLFHCMSLAMFLGFYQYKSNEWQSDFAFWFFFATLSLLILRETFQVFNNGLKDYFKHRDNYIEIGMIINYIAIQVIIICRFNCQNSSCMDSIPNLLLFKIIAVFFSSCEYISILRGIPEAACYVTIFKSVTIHCCKVLLVFMPLMCAFAYCFHVLALNMPEDAQVFFGHYMSSLFKTVIMLGGEFEISSLYFEKNTVLLGAVIILFILIMSIVVMNLLIALAFADIQKMKEDAELNELMARVKYFIQAERWLPNHLKLTSICLNEKLQMYVSPKKMGKVQMKVPDDPSEAQSFCLRCLSWRCQFSLSNRLLFKAKIVATKNIRPKKQKNHEVKQYYHKSRESSICELLEEDEIAIPVPTPVNGSEKLLIISAD